MTERRTQATRVAEKFGGVRPLAKALGVAPSTVYRWDYHPNRGGSGGIIPTRALPRIAAAAREKRVRLSAADFDPRPR
jgi:hypothetical protein